MRAALFMGLSQTHWSSMKNELRPTVRSCTTLPLVTIVIRPEADLLRSPLPTSIPFPHDYRE